MRAKNIHIIADFFKLRIYKPSFFGQEPTYTDFEQRSFDRFYNWFLKTNNDYGAIQAARPQTLGYAMHDSRLAFSSGSRTSENPA